MLAALFTLSMVGHRPGAILISQQELEEKYGLQVSLLGATAMNSIVDFRLKVLDADKASAILNEKHHDTLGLLIAGDENDIYHGGAHVASWRPCSRLAACTSRSFPIRATRSRSGTPVSVVFGELRLEPIVAQ